MSAQNSKEQPTSRTLDEPAPASGEQSEADPALQHALDKARGQIEDMIATIATKHDKSYEEVARHFFVDDEDVDGEDVDDEDIDDEDIDDEDIDDEDKVKVGYLVLPDEQKQTLLEVLLQRLDARAAAVSHRTTSKKKDDERRIPVHDVRMALNKLLNEELINLNATSAMQYFLRVVRSKTESIVEPPLHFNPSTGDVFQMMHLKPCELAASFEAFCHDEASIHGLVSKKNDLKNMIQSMLHDQLYASTGDKGARLEYSGGDDEMTRAQGIVIECDWSPV